MWEGEDVDLARLPIQTCWPGDAGPLDHLGTDRHARAATRRAQNLGIYRQQVIGRNKVIMRWLAHRGGALDFREFALANPGKPFPVAVVLGADPATILGAVTPVPDTLSEYQFAGLLRGGTDRNRAMPTPGVDTLQVPARAEIVLEGFIYPQDGPIRLHRRRAAATVEGASTNTSTRSKARSATTPAITTNWSGFRCSRSRGSPCVATRSITPPTPASRPTSPRCSASRSTKCSCRCCRSSSPEIADFYLPPEGCSYRMAIVQIRKSIRATPSA